MSRFFPIAAAIAAAVVSLNAQPALHLTIVSHNEEPTWRQNDYLNNQRFYLQNRELVRQLAVAIKARNAAWNVQSDWNFLLAVEKYDTPQVTASTNNKNILRWLVEDMGFELNPHAHESTYNYADVAYLHERIARVATPTVVGGFLYYPVENPQGWEQHSNGEPGVKNPSYFWKPNILWGAATGKHQGPDEESYGIWRPKDKTNFTTHSDTQRLIYIGSGCKSDFEETGPAGIDAFLNASNLNPNGFYTANYMINQGRLTTETITRVAAELDRLAANSRIIWSPLSKTVAQWQASGAQPFRAPCSSMVP
jgi:hypothetical protein